MSPTQRSLKMLRDDGYFVAIVEKYNSFIKRRIDLFNIADLLAFKGDVILLVQTTTASNVSARLAKINENPIAAAWKTPNRKIHIHGWSKRGERGKRKTWSARIIEV